MPKNKWFGAATCSQLVANIRARTPFGCRKEIFVYCFFVTFPPLIMRVSSFCAFVYMMTICCRSLLLRYRHHSGLFLVCFVYPPPPPAWSVKARHAPSQYCRDATVYGHTTAAMLEIGYISPVE